MKLAGRVEDIGCVELLKVDEGGIVEASEKADLPCDVFHLFKGESPDKRVLHAPP